MKLEKKLTIDNIPVEIHSTTGKYTIYKPINIDWEYPYFFVVLDDKVELEISIECDTIQGIGIVDKAKFKSYEK